MFQTNLIWTWKEATTRDKLRFINNCDFKTEEFFEQYMSQEVWCPTEAKIALLSNLIIVFFGSSNTTSQSY